MVSTSKCSVVRGGDDTKLVTHLYVQKFKRMIVSRNGEALVYEYQERYEKAEKEEEASAHSSL